MPGLIEREVRLPPSCAFLFRGPHQGVSAQAPIHTNQDPGEKGIWVYMKSRILRLPEVMEATGLSRTTIWRMKKRDEFPKSVQLGPRAVGWRSSDIEEWLNSRPASGVSSLPAA